MVISKNKFYFFIVFFNILILFIFIQFNDLLIGWGERLYTEYDSEKFYNARTWTISELLYDESYSYIAYKLYPIILSLINSFYNIFFANVSYQMMVFSNFFIYGLILIYYFKFINNSKLPNYVLILIIFEPSIIAFSLTLERELLISVLIGLFVLNYLYIRNVLLKLVFSILLLLLILNVRAEVFILLIFSYLLFSYINLFINKRRIYKVIAILFLLVPLVFFLVQVDEILQIYMRHIGDVQSGGGFGSLISSLPAIPRISLYSLFYFVMPIPIFTEKNYLYQYFIMFSGFSYSFFWIFLLKNYKSLEGKLIFLFILLLLLHIGLGGTLFNIRHRVEIVIPLIIMVLTLSKIIINNYGYDYLKKQFRLSLIITFIIVIGLNLVYYTMKGVM